MVNPSAIQILREACEKYGYHCEDISLRGGISVKVSDGRKFFYSGIGADYSVYPIHKHSVQKIVRSKWITKKIMQDMGEDFIPGQIFRLTEQGSKVMPHLIEACEVLPDDMFPAVWKPDIGQKGYGIKFIKDREELQRQIDIFVVNKKYNKVLIDKFIDEPEYRVFYVLGKVYFLYRQSRPYVIGDGTSTLEELINRKEFLALELVKTQTASFLGVKLDWVPEQEKTITLIGASNRIQGGGMDGYSENPPPHLEGWARKICETISMDICGFDVFIQNYGTSKMKMKVIELNFNPGLIGIYLLGKKETAFRIWKDILEHYFSH